MSKNIDKFDQMHKFLYLLIVLAYIPSACQTAKKGASVSVEPTISDSSVQVLFLGDLGFGEKYQEKNEERGRINVLKTYGYDHAFEKLGNILGQGDFTIANFESTINDLEQSPLEDEKSYVHQADPQFAPDILKKYGIDAVSLANNHAMDYGYEGLEQTHHYLEEKGIQYFGSGENLSHASVPFVKEVEIGDNKHRIYVLGWMSYRKSYKEKHKFYATESTGGINFWEEDRILNQIRAIKRKDSTAFIIAFPHWGSNYKWRSSKQKYQAHAMIDAGADVIIGHGAHMIQEIEKYRHKWICYNMGNFIFNSPGRYAKEKVDPYSFATLLALKRERNQWKYHLELYPLFSDNKQNNYQPFPLKESEFLKMYELLVDKSLLEENTRRLIYPDTNNNIITLY